LNGKGGDISREPEDMGGLDRTEHHGQRDADRPAEQATAQQTDRDEPVPPSEIPYGYHDLLLDPE